MANFGQMALKDYPRRRFGQVLGFTSTRLSAGDTAENAYPSTGFDTA
jgi:hypothetical protein